MQTTVTLKVILLDAAGVVQRRSIVHWPAGKPFTVADLVGSRAIGTWAFPEGWSVRVEKLDAMNRGVVARRKAANR